MKRTIIALMLSLILVNASGAQSAKKKAWSDKARDSLIGPIHTVRTETFLLGTEAGDLTQGPRIGELTILTYNREGDQTESDGYLELSDSHSSAPSEWKLWNKIITRFDLNGAKTESQSFNLHDGDRRLNHRWVYSSHANGTSVEELSYDRNGHWYRESLSTYTSDGEEIENVSFRSDGSVVNKTFFQYDAASRLISEATYRADGSVRGREVHAYDEKGNLVQDDSFDESLELFQRVVYSGSVFDSAGNWTKRTMDGWGQGDSTEALPTHRGITYRMLTYY